MTLTGRNLSLRFAFVLATIVSLVSVVVFGGSLNGSIPSFEVRASLEQLLAAGAAVLSAILGVILAAIYIRLFRRTPSLSVFFVIWYFLSMTVDILKLGQLLLPVTGYSHLAPLFSRGTMFGHVVGVMALFGAGLYAGGVRMQRHGTAMTAATVIALGLLWSMPIDTSVLPANLVFPAGIRSSLQAALFLFLGVAVLNFVHAALNNANPRQLMSAIAVAVLATGRELLYYRIEPVWIIVGVVMVCAGGVLFASQNYRDFLVS